MHRDPSTSDATAVALLQYGGWGAPDGLRSRDATSAARVRESRKRLASKRRTAYNSRRAAGSWLLPTGLEPAAAVRILCWTRVVPLLGRPGFFFRPRLKNQRGRLHRQTTESSYQAKNALSPAASARALNGSLHTSRLARSARSAPLSGGVAGKACFE